MKKFLIAAGLVTLLANSSFAALSEIEGNNTLPTANIIPAGAYIVDGGAGVLGHLSPGDVDYYAVLVSAGDLIGGAIFDYTPFNGTDNDSYLGLFDPFGVLVMTDDDNGTVFDDINPNYLSSLHYIADSSGYWTFAVSGYGDTNFDGSHSEDFDYLFDFSTDAPEPATMGLLLVGAAFAARRRR